jgi:hypothetical protein
MRVQSRRRFSISAATLLVLSTAFSCSYGDDDDDKKHKREKKVEAILPQRLVVRPPDHLESETVPSDVDVAFRATPTTPS